LTSRGKGAEPLVPRTPYPSAFGARPLSKEEVDHPTRSGPCGQLCWPPLGKSHGRQRALFTAATGHVSLTIDTWGLPGVWLRRANYRHQRGQRVVPAPCLGARWSDLVCAAHGASRGRRALRRSSASLALQVSEPRIRPGWGEPVSRSRRMGAGWWSRASHTLVQRLLCSKLGLENSANCLPTASSPISRRHASISDLNA
jgi:hypothetical protein